MNEIPAILRLADGAVLAIYRSGLRVRIAPDGSTSTYTRNAELPGQRAKVESSGGPHNRIRTN